MSMLKLLSYSQPNLSGPREDTCDGTTVISMNGTGAAKELTRADIRAIAARIYEPQPRIWSDGGWQCPQCRKVNIHILRECGCGITRDGLPEYCEWSEEARVAAVRQPMRAFIVTLNGLYSSLTTFARLSFRSAMNLLCRR